MYIHKIAGLLKSKNCLAIPAIIWKPNFMNGCDDSNCSDQDRWDRTRFYLSDRCDRYFSKKLMEITFLAMERSEFSKLFTCISYRSFLNVHTSDHE